MNAVRREAPAVVVSPRAATVLGIPWSRAAALLLLAVVVRLGALLVVNHPELARGEFSFRDDEMEYHAIASTLVDTGAYALAPDGPPTARRSPGMVVGLAAAYWALGTSPLVALVWVMLCSVALVACVGALARATTGDPRVTATAMAITALMPTAVFAGAGIWSEPTALFATVLAVVLLVRAEQDGGAARWACVGAAAAVAFLTRTSVVFLLPFLLLRALRSRDARVVVALCVALAAPVVLWGMRNQVALGRFLVGYGMAGQGMWENNNPVSAGIAAPSAAGPEVAEAARRGELRGSWVPRAYLPGTAEALRDDPDELEADRRLGALAGAFVREHPGAYLRLLGFKLRRLLAAEPIAAPFIDESAGARVAKRVLTFVERWALLVLGTLGLVMLHRAGDRWRHHHLVLALAGVPVVLLGLVNARFFLPIAVALTVPAAVALVGRRREARRTPAVREVAA